MSRIRLWPGIIFALLGVHACVVATTFYLANADPSVAVEPDYYGKALAWDRQQSREADSKALGWIMTLEPGPVAGARTTLAITLVGPDGSAVTGASVRVESFANVRSGQRRLSVVGEQSPGRYVGEFNSDRSGLWQFRVTASRGPDIFVATVERQVAAPGSATP